MLAQRICTGPMSTDTRSANTGDLQAGVIAETTLVTDRTSGADCRTGTSKNLSERGADAAGGLPRGDSRVKC